MTDPLDCVKFVLDKKYLVKRGKNIDLDFLNRGAQPEGASDMHDRNGTPLKVGDIIMIPARVTLVQPGPDYCNLSAQSLYGRKPDDMNENFSINTSVVILHERSL